MINNKVIYQLIEEGKHIHSHRYTIHRNGEIMTVHLYYNYCTIAGAKSKVDIFYDYDEETTNRLLDSIAFKSLTKSDYIYDIEGNGNIVIHVNGVMGRRHSTPLVSFKTKGMERMDIQQFLLRSMDILQEIDFDPEAMDEFVHEYETLMNAGSMTKNARN